MDEYPGEGMVKILVGVIGESHGWEQLLCQEGVPFRVLRPGEELPPEEYSAVIVPRPLDGPAREVLEAYLRGGGALVACAAHLQGIAGRRERLTFLLGDDGGRLGGVGLLDAGVEGFVPREAQDLRTESGSPAVFAGPHLGGTAVLLPFDVGSLIGDGRHAIKNFPARPDRLPSERVSLVAKGEIWHLVHAALEFLHHERGLPYVHRWYFPDGAPTVFAFRIDTDGAPREDVEEQYRLGRESLVPLSWFVDVRSHGDLLPFFGTMVGQEIGVHCYEHRVYATREENGKNFLRARRVMEERGLRPEGLAAPYGIWSEVLGQAAADCGFSYSSEFSFAYDTLPLAAPPLGERPALLQIPIHPVCVGSLRRVGYSLPQMERYFESVVDEKIRRREPLLFYHHPSHRAWPVIRRIFEKAAGAGIPLLTFRDIARWWGERTSSKVDISFASGSLTLQGPGLQESWFACTKPGGKEARFRGRGEVDLGELTWAAPEVYQPPPDLRRIREFDPRRLLSDIHTTMIRRFR